MAEYASLRKIEFELCGGNLPEKYKAFVRRVLNDRNLIPSADVAPVVRCKDCEHYDMGVCLKIYSDGNVHPEAWQERKPEDFCSYGEPKDGGECE